MYIFQKAVPDLTPVTVVVLLHFGPSNAMCPLWKLITEISGLSPETRPHRVTLYESLPLSGPKILGQMTLQAP